MANLDKLQARIIDCLNKEGVINKGRAYSLYKHATSKEISFVISKLLDSGVIERTELDKRRGRQPETYRLTPDFYLNGVRELCKSVPKLAAVQLNPPRDFDETVGLTSERWADSQIRKRDIRKPIPPANVQVDGENFACGSDDKIYIPQNAVMVRFNPFTEGLELLPVSPCAAPIAQKGLEDKISRLESQVGDLEDERKRLSNDLSELQREHDDLLVGIRNLTGSRY